MADIHEEIMQGSEFFETVNLFNEEVEPEIKKLTFLADAVYNDTLDNANFIDSPKGLYHILHEIVKALKKYENDLDEIWKVYQKRNKPDPHGVEQARRKERSELHIKMAWDYLNKAFEGAEDKEKLLDSLRVWIEGARLEQKAPKTEGKAV